MKDDRYYRKINWVELLATVLLFVLVFTAMHLIFSRVQEADTRLQQKQSCENIEGATFIDGKCHIKRDRV